MSLVLIYQEKTKQLIEKLMTCAIELLEKEFTFAYWGVRYPPPGIIATTALISENRKDHEQDYNSDEEELIQQIRTINKPISQLFLDTLLQHRQQQSEQDNNQEKSQLWHLYQEWPWHIKTG